MLNSQQMVVHMPMFEGLKIPANSMTIVEYLIKLATFDLIDTSFIDELLYYWPEADPFTTNFEMAGIESVLLLANIGFSMYLIYMHILIVLVHACVHKLKHRGCLFQRLDAKMGSYLYWDGLTRFYMEL